MLTAPSWDFAPIGAPPYQPPTLASPQEILDLFDRNAAKDRKAIEEVKADQLKPWSLIAAGAIVFTIPRWMVLRR